MWEDTRGRLLLPSTTPSNRTSIGPDQAICKYAKGLIRGLLFQLCADSYCNYDHYMTHVYEGFATGFEPTYVIYEQTNDT
jgi:hypothetical protein